MEGGAGSIRGAAWVRIIAWEVAGVKEDAEGSSVGKKRYVEVPSSLPVPSSSPFPFLPFPASREIAADGWEREGRIVRVSILKVSGNGENEVT